jgi:succinate dehydrogenase flavin-adding protein (antitoxin of CptAB toxin-antitoxin module)
MSPQPEDGESIWSLYRKAVNKNLYWKAVNGAVENDLIKIFVNWSWEGLNKSELKHLTRLKSELILEN